MSEKFSTMQKSADSKESADSLIRNPNYPSLEQLNCRAKEQEKQRKSHEKTENEEHQKADLELENEILELENTIVTTKNLNDFINEKFKGNIQAFEIAKKYLAEQDIIGRSINQNELKQKVNSNLIENKELSNEDKIKNYKEELSAQGKSKTEILRLLIANFEGNESIGAWLNNWKSFLKLHQFAETKSPVEKRAIHKIISKADFSSENAFTTTLEEISQSNDLSNETKFEISREFGGSINSVDAMDYQLQQVKTHKKEIEKAIDKKNEETESLDSEIQNIEARIDRLPLNDPKRLELEKELEQKKEVLEQTENEINSLEKGKIQDVSFQLREGFNSVLNPDGSRSIKIMDGDFSIKLTNNFLPFRTTASLNSINLAFSYNALKQNNIADFIFRPNLVNGSVPSRSQRRTSELILSNLGYDTTRIISKENIKQLNKDLSSLNSQVGKTGEDSLIELGVFDANSRSLNTGRLKEVLTLVCDNRGLRDEMVFEKLRNYNLSSSAKL